MFFRSAHTCVLLIGRSADLRTTSLLYRKKYRINYNDSVSHYKNTSYILFDEEKLIHISKKLNLHPSQLEHHVKGKMRCRYVVTAIG